MKPNGERGAAAVGLLVSPFAIWALHFLAVYVTAAVYCAKAGDPDTPVIAVWKIVPVLTIAALAALTLVLRLGHRRFRPAPREPGKATVSGPVEADPWRFFRTVLLWASVLSAAAIVCVASVAFVFGDCR